MLDSEIDVIPTVLRYLGKSPDSTDAADLAAVEHTLMAIRPYIRNFASGGALEALATGQVCLAMDYSGDVAQAAERAEQAHRGVTVRYRRFRRKARRSASTCWRFPPTRRTRTPRCSSSISCSSRT